MKAEIIAIGSELLTPHHLDTNSLALTRGLLETGFEVHIKTVVGDTDSDLAAVLEAALRRSRIILLSGGLGPTEDDITRRVVAAVLGRSLRLDPRLVEAIRERFRSRGYTMPAINERQAEVIEGAEVLENPLGTAPGQWIEHEGCAIALLPGPPREILPMFETAVLPRLRSLGGGRRMVERSFHILGMTESDVDARAAPVYTTYQPRISTTILAAPGHIALRCWQWVAGDEQAAELEELSARLHETLGDAVFTTSNEPLEHVVGALLAQQELSLAVAESCTAGLLAWRLTRTPGSSRYFLGGVVCYSNDAKTALCGVPAETIDRHGAVSAEVAEALARGARERFRSSIGVGITGIAGPDGGTAEKPVGLVHVGIADAARSVQLRRVIPGDRDAIRERAAYFALGALRRFLLSPSP